MQYQTDAERMKFYKSKPWRKLRQSILERDNYECQECKRQGKVFTKHSKPGKHKVFDVDHIKELEDHPELAMEPDNLETLCIRCHNHKHGRYVWNAFQFKRKPTKWDDDEKW
ncbi:HNH endonuclease [Alkalibacillus almallahensis]|uniref:HNH endonuclease n=1 Tax=Alkalibacillus almallahensis TaxID=1379154 RepID=UPI00141E7355|nr:HNH endonuclease [Alkalibacillus almallahensis]NIK11182.1 5-methylcytosine-specific restriction endonuclease McrA [Alkalibacillus almallahensis]